jgi:hypothetical protein
MWYSVTLLDHQHKLLWNGYVYILSLLLVGYAAGYKRPVELEMLDPTGVVVEKWLLDGTMLTNVGFGDLAMDDDSIAEVTTTLRFDRAILLF